MVLVRSRVYRIGEDFQFELGAPVPEELPRPTVRLWVIGPGNVEVQCTKREALEWKQAHDACLAALKEAELDFLRDRGLERVRELGMQVFRVPRRNRLWQALPGSARRAAAHAAERLSNRVRDIDAEYAPIREVIGSQVVEVFLAQSRSRDRMMNVAHRMVWRYQVHKDEVRVFAVADRGLDIWALGLKLLAIRRKTGQTRVVWESKAVAEVEQACGAGFVTWWQTVGSGSWTNPYVIPRNRRTGDGQVVRDKAPLRDNLEYGSGYSSG